MYSPTTRLLTVLELLQSKAGATGPELAARLEVDVRSVRRYITMLRDMGIPVESEPGRYGSYYLRPGFRLPPLMFNNSEILAVILGLMAVRHLGLAESLGIESAAAKIERVLPDELRERVLAVQAVLTLDMPRTPNAMPGQEMIAHFSHAAYQHNELWIEYQGHQADKTERVIDVYGLVFHAANWYAVAYCHLRQDLRCFRLDRVQQLRVLNTSFEPPPAFDALTYLLNSIASFPGTWQVEVLLKTTMEEARMRVPPATALLEEADEGVLLRSWADGLDWFAHFLIGLRCPLVVLHPPELRDELRRVGQRIVEMADAVQ